MKQNNIPIFNKAKIPNDFTGKCKIVYDYGVYEGHVVKGLAEGQGKMTWSNGNKYEGDWKDNKMEGKGVYYYKSGNRYEGDFKNDKKEGKGTITWSNGDKYEGDWKDNKIEGKGTITWSNGDKYEGDFKNDKKEGKGVYYFKSGNRYEGDWKNNKKEGKGVCYLKSGNRYEGDFKNNKMEGKGVYYYKSGNRYEGDFKNNKMEGKGVYYFKSGDKYEGDWKNNKKEGKGVCYLKSGNRYEGDFKNNKMEGKGVYYFKSGDKYEGDFKNDKMEGKGTITWSNGDKYEGDFKNDKKEGKGVYDFKNGNRYDGYWKNNKKEGKGVYDFKNGNRFEGDVKNNKIVKKRPLGKTKNIKSKQRKMFYQINKHDNSETIKQKEYKILQTIDQQNKFINNKQNIKPKPHIKISYNDHGGKDGILQADINKDLFTNIVNTDTKSFYISSNSCHGGFYDENKTTLFDIVKEQIKDKDCIGFVSLVKQEYSHTIQSTINDKGETGVKRMPINKQGVNVEDVYKNKDKYFEYYCILNEKNKETGEKEQNIYKIPSQLCYWREDLIEQKDKTYGNKFMEAFNVLKEKTEKNDKIHDYIFNNDNVELEGKNVKNFNILINGKINKVEIKEVTKPKIKTDYTQYEIKEIENKNPKKRTKTTTKKQQKNNKTILDN